MLLVPLCQLKPNKDATRVVTSDNFSLNAFTVKNSVSGQLAHWHQQHKPPCWQIAQYASTADANSLHGIKRPVLSVQHASLITAPPCSA